MDAADERETPAAGRIAGWQALKAHGAIEDRIRQFTTPFQDLPPRESPNPLAADD